VGGACFIAPAMLIVLVSRSRTNTGHHRCGERAAVRHQADRDRHRRTGGVEPGAHGGPRPVTLALAAVAVAAIYLANGNTLLALLGAAVVVMLFDNRRTSACGPARSCR